MDLAAAERWLEELASTQSLRSFGVHGGEPFLHFKHLKRIVERARKLGIPQIWVITNSYWAKTRAAAKRKLVELKAAGLNSITFSADGFHQEFIPLENVQNAIGAAVSVGLDRVVVDSYLIASQGTYNPYDRLTRKVLENLQCLDMVEVHRYNVGFEGRAAQELVKYAALKAEVPSGNCRLPFWIGGSLRAPEAVEIDADGNVTLCPGICIGSIRVQPLTGILENYNVAEHPILSVIAEKGPMGLLEVAVEKGYPQGRRFVDECHLCYEMRKFLRPFYPRYLAPEACY